MRSLGTPNLADFFSLLKAFDPQGIKRQSDYRRLGSRGSNKYDLLESLVNLMEDRDYDLSINDIKHLFLVDDDFHS
ncbi:hypothetical protein ACS0TY_014754 [Phlomoides rotata]